MDAQGEARPPDEPSLAWYGRPHTEVAAEPESSPADQVASVQQPDLYGRVVMSAVVIGGALLLARSRTFRQVTWRLARFALMTWLPAQLASEVRRAWRDAAPPAKADADAADSHRAAPHAT